MVHIITKIHSSSPDHKLLTSRVCICQLNSHLHLVFASYMDIPKHQHPQSTATACIWTNWMVPPPCLCLARRWWRRRRHGHGRRGHSTTLLWWGWGWHPHRWRRHTGRRRGRPYHANRRRHHVWWRWPHWKPVLELLCHGGWRTVWRSRPSRLPVHLHRRRELSNRSKWRWPNVLNLSWNCAIAIGPWHWWTAICQSLGRWTTCKHCVWPIPLRSWVVCCQQSLCWCTVTLSLCVFLISIRDSDWPVA